MIWIALSGWACAVALSGGVAVLLRKAAGLERLLDQFHVAYQMRRMAGDRS